MSLFTVLNRMSFWTGSLEQGVNVGGVPSTCVVPTMFLKSNSIMSFLKRILSAGL